ncbi:MAG: alpha/beta fold hydrolase, partial [Micromonosporaceae bacterium]|nr:alpha/beta fold hydrolase [Micromonosporaceae bacterium]
LESTFETRLALVRDPRSQPTLRRYLGQRAFAEYLRMARTGSRHHLAGGGRHVVVVPGVMGSLLASAGLGGIWWISVRARHHLNDLRLSADGMADADPRHAVGPVSVHPVYEPLFMAIHTCPDLCQRGLPYDWRKPLDASTEAVAEAVLAARSDSGGQPVHVVAHSMGGLLVRAALLRHPQLWRHLGNIVFLGTPHYGSPAIAYYLKHHLRGFNLLALLGRYLDRATFRSLWGVLSLLPAPAGVYPGTRTAPSGSSETSDAGQAGSSETSDRGQGNYQHPCIDFDPYNAEAWRLGLDREETSRLQAVLNGADRLHRELFDWHCALDQSQRDRMLVIAGVGQRSLFRVSGVDETTGRPRQRLERTVTRRPGDPHQEGDGRVPLASAQLEWVADTRYTRGEHLGLCHSPTVHDDIVRFFTERPLLLPQTPEQALRDHLQGQADTQDAEALLARPAIVDDDPGYLRFDEAHGDAVLGDPPPLGCMNAPIIF